MYTVCLSRSAECATRVEMLLSQHHVRAPFCLHHMTRVTQFAFSVHCRELPFSIAMILLTRRRFGLHMLNNTTCIHSPPRCLHKQYSHQSAKPGLGSLAETLGPPHIRTFPLTHTAPTEFLLSFDSSSQTTKTTFDHHPTHPFKYHRNGT